MHNAMEAAKIEKSGDLEVGNHHLTQIAREITDILLNKPVSNLINT